LLKTAVNTYKRFEAPQVDKESQKQNLMLSWLETYKPTASIRTQLWLAGAMWSTVGMVLLAVGTYWLLTKSDNVQWLLMIIIAACLGIGKSFLILDRVVNRIVRRIQLREEGRCLGGFLSLKVWIMVAGMMLLGRFLRSTSIHPSILGAIYAAVGVGLLMSSRIVWRALKDQSELKIS
jgi:putative flippase GtrA